MLLKKERLLAVEHWFIGVEVVTVVGVYLLPVLDKYTFERKEVIFGYLYGFEDLEIPFSEELFFENDLTGIFFKFELFDNDRFLGDLSSLTDKTQIAQFLYKNYFNPPYIEKQLSKINLPYVEKDTILNFMLPNDEKKLKEQILIIFFKRLIEEEAIDGCDPNIKSQSEAIQYYPPDEELIEFKNVSMCKETYDGVDVSRSCTINPRPDLTTSVSCFSGSVLFSQGSMCGWEMCGSLEDGYW
jgi:hypothetical protein